jgi:hypothetical protein
MALPEAIIMRDTRANQPSAVTTAAGTIYCVTDEGYILERTNGTDWEAYSSSAPGLVLLATYTASASASFNVTSVITSSYDTYMFQFESLVPASNSRLRMLVSTDNGSSWDTSNVYRWVRLTLQGASTNSAGSNTSWDWQSGDDTLTSNASYNGTLYLVNPLNASLNKVMYGHITIDENVSIGWVPSSWGGTWRNTTAVNALQVKFASGNITSGTLRVYGVAK